MQLSPSPTLSRSGNLVEIDRSAFTASFAHQSLAVRHHLADHPLFTIDAIAELADRLPPRSVRRERGNLPLGNAKFRYVDVGAGPPSETVRNVEQNGIRISLRDIQQVPEYAQLIDECLDEVAELVGGREGGMTHRAGYLFISAPASTTPLHVDAEHSFLLQVKGVKHVSCATSDQSPVLHTAELGRYIKGGEDDFDALRQAATTTNLEAGVGVYLPSFVPHWVETEAGISISFSIPFYTPHADQAEGVWWINKQLRQLHLSPRPLGRSARVDAAKAVAFRSLRKARRAFDRA